MENVMVYLIVAGAAVYTGYRLLTKRSCCGSCATVPPGAGGCGDKEKDGEKGGGRNCGCGNGGEGGARCCGGGESRGCGH